MMKAEKNSLKELSLKLETMEQKLAESEAKFQNLMQAATDAIVGMNETGAISLWNKAAEKMFGYSEREAIGQDLHAFIIPENYRPVATKGIMDFLKTGEGPVLGKTLEITAVRKGGSEFPVELSVSVLKSEDTLWILGIIRDISQRKQIEKALKTSEEKYRTLIENMYDIVYSSDLDGVVTFIGPQTKRYGIKPEHIIGRNFLEFVYREDQERLAGEYQRSLKYREEFPSQFRLVDAQGQIHWFEDRGKIQTDLHGNITGMAGVLRDISERKRVEEDLQSLHQQNKLILDSINDGILGLDLKGNTTFINPAVTKLTGWQPEDLIGQNGHEKLHYSHQSGEPFPISECPILKTIDDGVVKRGNHEVYWRKDGTHFPVEYHSTPIFENGEIVGAVVSFRDISERKQAETEIKEREEFLSSIFENIPISLFIKKADDLTFIRCNKAREELFGYSRDELIGKTNYDIFPEDIASSLTRKDKEVLESGTLVDIPDEIVQTRSNGKRNLHTKKIPILADSGGPKYILGISEDITEKKLAEIEIRKLSQAVEQSPVSIMITDLQGNIEYVNPRFSEVTGYSFEEVKGQNPRILKSGEKPLEEYQELWSTITSGKLWQGEFHNKKKSGELFWEDAKIGSIKDDHENITHFVAVKEDITERKKLEEQFRQAQRLEAVGRLAGGVAHDFNNLLTVINGYSDFILLDIKQENPLYNDVVEIRKAGKRAADLTRQLLAFSRRQVFELQVLDLNLTIQDLEKMLRRIIGENIKLITSLSDNLGNIYSDSGQVEQVITNLIVNAKDAIAYNGKITIETKNVELDQFYSSTHDHVSPGNYVMLAISDTGEGMTEEICKQIFEPFFTTKELGKGTGLGLATVYGIVKQSGGYIWVYSEPGHGTTFKIYFPRVDAMPENKKTNVGDLSLLGGTETILLVEDDDMVRSVAQEMLNKNGYTIFSAKNGEEALQICEQQKDSIHLLLTDVIMPGMNAKELVEKANTLCPNMKVIYTSGYTDDTIAQHGILDPGVNLLQKPFSRDKLLQKVREVLNG